MDASDTDDESVVGDECHIISEKLTGPRYDPKFPEAELDSYNNLLLLCRVHHKQVDDQVTTFTADILHKIKMNHEKWVSEKLSSDDAKQKPVGIKRIKENIPEYLIRLTTGRELLSLIDGTFALAHDHDELQNVDEVELVSNFFQQVSDYADLSSEWEPSDKVRISFALTQLLEELEQVDLLVFGAQEIQVLEGGTEPPEYWSVAIIQIRRKMNKSIKRLAL